MSDKAKKGNGDDKDKANDKKPKDFKQELSNILTPKELTSKEIGDFGEQHAADELRGMGYSTNVDTKQPGSTDIEANGARADGTKLSLLVQVKTTVHPGVPEEPWPDEIRNIKSRAGNTNRTAFIALVTIDPAGKFMRMTWRQP